MKKSLLSLALIFLPGGVALGHPEFNPGTCVMLKRGHAGQQFNLDTAEELDFRAPLLKIGDTSITCVGDLGPGPAETLNFANTGETCLLGPEANPVAKTKVWTEFIKANGETTLICTFGPR